MTLPQYRELAAYWRKFPPAHLVLQAMTATPDSRPGDIGALLDVMPGR